MIGIDDVVNWAMKLSAQVQAASMAPKHSDTIATITVRRMAFMHLINDASLRATNPREWLPSEEMFVQTHNGYRVRIVPETEF